MWEVLRKNFNPIQPTYTLIYREPGARVTTKYQQADGLARRKFGEVSLVGTRYTFHGFPTRTYASQNY